MSLTRLERRIADLAAIGLANKEIGERTDLSARTVSTHLYRIFPLLGVTTRAALGPALKRLDEASPTPAATAGGRAGSAGSDERPRMAGRWPSRGDEVAGSGPAALWDRPGAPDLGKARVGTAGTPLPSSGGPAAGTVVSGPCRTWRVRESVRTGT